MAVDKNPWVESVKSLGVPTVFSCAFMYAIWCAGSWAGETVIVPLFKKQMDFIDQASKMTDEMNQTTRIINQTLEAHGQHAIESLKTCQDIRETGLKTNGTVEVIHSNNDQILNVLKNIDENTKPLRHGMP
jgi:hypothetical protein